MLGKSTGINRPWAEALTVVTTGEDVSLFTLTEVQKAMIMQVKSEYQE